jgi:hypothetical protein
MNTASPQMARIATVILRRSVPCDRIPKVSRGGEPPKSLMIVWLV